MNTRNHCFLAVAHTLHMGQAAEILHISQQGVSDNIRRLENALKVKLFFRKPKLQLTPEGRIYMNGLQRIQQIEKNMLRDMHHNYSETSGRVRFGIGTYRIHDSIVRLLQNFQQIYPDIRVDILHAESKELETMLLKGEVDVFIGFNVKFHEDFRRHGLVRETPRVLIIEKQFEYHFSKEERRQILEYGLNREQLQILPFISNYPKGSLWQSYERAFNRFGIQLRIIGSSNDFSEIIKLCSAGYGVALCPDFLSTMVDEINAASNYLNQLYAIRVAGLSWVNSIEIITHNMRNISDFLNVFIKMAEAEIFR